MADQFVGEIRIFTGNFAPRDWLFCNGAILPVNQYTSLYSLLGDFYGGDGRTTFGLPDLQGRVPIHQGQGPGLTRRIIGQRGGKEEVTLSTEQIPSHSHIPMGSPVDADATAPQGNSFANTTGDYYFYRDAVQDELKALTGQTVENAGSGEAHSNLMPYLAVNYIIAVNGIYPERK